MKIVHLKFKDGTDYKTLAYDDQPMEEIVDRAYALHSKVKDADALENVRNLTDKLIELELFTERELMLAFKLDGESMNTLNRLSQICYGKNNVYDLLSEKDTF